MSRQKPWSVNTVVILLSAILSHRSYAHHGSSRFNVESIATNDKFPDGIINVPPFLSFEEVVAFVDSVDSKGFVTAGYHYLNFQEWPARAALGSYTNASFVALADEIFMIQKIREKKLSIILNIDRDNTSSSSALADVVKGYFALGIEIIVLNNLGELPPENWRNEIEGLVNANRPDAKEATTKGSLFFGNAQSLINTKADTKDYFKEVLFKKKENEWISAIKVFNQYFQKANDVHFPYEKQLQLSYSNTAAKNNGQLGVEEAKSLMSLWCLADFPIQINNDVRNLNNIGTHVLANGEIIALGKNPGPSYSKCLYNESNMQVYVKQTSYRKEDGLAIVIVNLDTIANKFILPAELFNFTGKFLLKDLWEQKNLGHFDAYIAVLPPHGCRVFRAVSD